MRCTEPSRAPPPSELQPDDGRQEHAGRSVAGLRDGDDVSGSSHLLDSSVVYHGTESWKSNGRLIQRDKDSSERRSRRREANYECRRSSYERRKIINEALTPRQQSVTSENEVTLNQSSHHLYNDARLDSSPNLHSHKISHRYQTQERNNHHLAHWPDALSTHKTIQLIVRSSPEHQAHTGVRMSEHRRGLQSALAVT